MKQQTTVTDKVKHRIGQLDDIEEVINWVSNVLLNSLILSRGKTLFILYIVNTSINALLLLQELYFTGINQRDAESQSTRICPKN